MKDLKIGDKIEVISDKKSPNGITHDIPIGHKSKIFAIDNIKYKNNIYKGYKIMIKYFDDIDHYYFTYVFYDEIKKLENQKEQLNYNDKCSIY